MEYIGFSLTGLHVTTQSFPSSELPAAALETLRAPRTEGIILKTAGGDYFIPRRLNAEHLADCERHLIVSGGEEGGHRHRLGALHRAIGEAVRIGVIIGRQDLSSEADGSTGVGWPGAGPAISVFALI
jgi:hypothetical protein